HGGDLGVGRQLDHDQHALVVDLDDLAKLANRALTDAFPDYLHGLVSVLAIPRSVLPPMPCEVGIEDFLELIEIATQHSLVAAANQCGVLAWHLDTLLLGVDGRLVDREGGARAPPPRRAAT